MTDNTHLDEFTKELISVVCRDRGGRKLPFLCSAQEFAAAADEFARLSNVAVISGFFIPTAGAPETDGPGGAVALARAYQMHGKNAQIWTDKLCFNVMREAALSLGMPGETVQIAPESLRGIDGLIFTERIGRASDGAYYNFRKIDITEFSPSLDDLALQASELKIPVLGIGDGGNEVGMGNFYDRMACLAPEYEKCLCRVKAKYAISADVSNWGAYAFAAALSHIWGAWCGFDERDEELLLSAVVKAGAVDGISGKPEPTVDGFSFDIQNKILNEIKNIWYNHCVFNKAHAKI